MKSFLDSAIDCEELKSNYNSVQITDSQQYDLCEIALVPGYDKFAINTDHSVYFLLLMAAIQGEI